MRSKIAASCVLALLAAPRGTAQAPVSPAFDAVSIKRNTSGDSSMRIRTPPGQFVMVNGPVMAMIGIAHPTVNQQQIDAPDWATSERYDVTARAEGTPSREQLAEMVRALLIDRFKLAAHVEPRERPVYVMSLVRADRSLGPSMRKVDIDCAARAAAASRGNPPPALQVPEGVPACTIRSSGGSMLAGGVSMSVVAQILTGPAGRTVVNKTGLDGDYAFTLNYSRDPGGAGDAAGDASLFTAMREQLGLKLDAQRSLVDVLVVDRLERPTEN